MATHRLYGLVFLALAASPALAGSPCTDPPIPKFGELAAEPIVIEMTPANIRATCDAHNAFRYIYACADEVTNTVYLTAPRYLVALGWSSVDIACLEKHERAHLWHQDGTRWPATHRGRVSR